MKVTSAKKFAGDSLQNCLIQGIVTASVRQSPVTVSEGRRLLPSLLPSQMVEGGRDGSKADIAAFLRKCMVHFKQSVTRVVCNGKITYESDTKMFVVSTQNYPPWHTCMESLSKWTQKTTHP